MTVRKPMKSRKNERGAVLLTTLLLMTVMAGLAVAIMDDIRFSVNRAVGVQNAAQADWYMRGGEAFAENWLNSLNSPNSNVADNQAGFAQIVLAQQPIVFPFGEGQDVDSGDLGIVVSDGRNCFNVNQLANSKTNKITRGLLADLLTFLQFDTLQAESFAASIQDWVDGDIIPEQGGAEDLTYTAKNPPYHAANTLMMDITELRAIEGITEDIYVRMQPFLCASADMKANKINLNTLHPEQWPLLAILFDRDEGEDDEEVQVAKAVIAQRPLAGYETVGAVWALPVVADLELRGAGQDMTDVKTDLVNLEIIVRRGEQTRRQQASFSLSGEAGARLLSRRGAY
ncbi:MAG: hypothetical protein COA91_11945 [Robiginitomaculum sp.]|nr:MAG: hypothetical protein COA91_11945 [Robiginitomaculum sp.]